MFAPGETVRVKDEWPEAAGPVHIRTPHYVRGVQGKVVRLLGEFPNPEDLAFARPAERRPLYHVLFRKGAIWPPVKAGDALAAEPQGKVPVEPDGKSAAEPDDELLIEIFGHWLERP